METQQAVVAELAILLRYNPDIIQQWLSDMLQISKSMFVSLKKDRQWINCRFYVDYMHMCTIFKT